ncbi:MULTISPECIES: transglycosylase domain-containing protein [unclassified Peribacillus]|uniref:transglycosylase domain-containing protein n=1 Tax=unclassified Peribacillus TaxID=2675266 RepID=UPI001911C715|nr:MULTISPECIES: PBP1A family penicillin-binding protein [unclassified Peribacillus]MBK5445327.1 PBP1A family penicillin-binding protein [Peribacillus sp. TH24]MBK5498139.1 PBP1A family penicillin-binding protein [Peribacillus sp. TH14]WMX56742.1 PBP1A family penicillin-binding protein [Peribacillus sp. R9-11]
MKHVLDGKMGVQMRGLVKIGLIIILAMVVFGAGLLFYFKQGADISLLQNHLQQPTEIYDLDGNLASTITGNKSEGVAIEEIPDHMKQAVVSIEDHRFYEHHGIDYQGILRALVKNAKAGSIVEGGSTLTQQLVKITMLESERTLKRKVEEFFLAQEVEDKYTKDEILEMYLNQVYFGHGAWGIKKAANIYFSKEVSELTVAEGALLAGVINLPSKLDPYKNLDGAMKRRDLVLSRMAEHGYLTDDEEAAAKKDEVTLLQGEQMTDPLKGKYPYFVDHVLSEASSRYGIELEELLTKGYKIYTTLDQSMQQATETVYANDANFPVGTSTDELVQSGAILLDPKTGGIKALVGGRGKHQFMGYNRATQLTRSPGSAIKPLVVYTPAVEEGYDITTPLKDEKMSFGEYEPTNLSGIYKGEVPMYEAMMNSLNVPTVWLLNEIGIDKGLDSLKRFGIPYKKGDRNLTIALGGMDKGVSPLQMAGAFSTFANDGKRLESHAIIKIENIEGKEVGAWEEKAINVTSKGVVDKMNTMLLGTVEYGTAKNAAVSGYEVAGKTGSTQVPIEGISGVKDQWFIGYTPSLVGAVWAGYDKTDEKHYLTTHSSEGSAIIFQKIMSQALRNQASQSFNTQDIGPLIAEQQALIAEQQAKKEEVQRKQYWIDKGNQIREGLNKWKDWKVPW